MRSTLPLALALATACLTPIAAPAAEYTLLIHETEAQLALRADRGPAGAAYWAGYAELGRAMTQAGILRGGAALDTAATPASTGPATRLGGYFVIDVPDLDAARAWAARVPVVTGRVEIRAHIPGPGM